MADKRITEEFITQELRSDALSSHVALVAGFRDTLAGTKSPLDSIPAEELEQSRREFRQLPELAGDPLPSSGNLEPSHRVEALRDIFVALVRLDGPDLSARELGVFLTCYLRDGVHTLHDLAADLNVSKPVITRALDRLGELDLARRKVDPMDRRIVVVQRTLKGAFLLRDLRRISGEASRKTHAGAAKPAKRRRG